MCSELFSSTSAADLRSAQLLGRKMFSEVIKIMTKLRKMGAKSPRSVHTLSLGVFVRAGLAFSTSLS